MVRGSASSSRTGHFSRLGIANSASEGRPKRKQAIRRRHGDGVLDQELKRSQTLYPIHVIPNHRRGPLHWQTATTQKAVCKSAFCRTTRGPPVLTATIRVCLGYESAILQREICPCCPRRSPRTQIPSLGARRRTVQIPAAAPRHGHSRRTIATFRRCGTFYRLLQGFWSHHACTATESVGAYSGASPAHQSVLDHVRCQG